MATAAALSAVRHATSSPDRAWFWAKIALAIFMPPAAVAVELHSFDKISLALMGVALLLWLLGWLPGVMFAIFIIVSSTGKNRVINWFKKRMPGSAGPPQADVEAGGAKSGFASWFGRGGGASSSTAAPAPAPAPATSSAAAAAPTAPAGAAPPPAAAAAPAKSGGWFGGGK